MLEWRGRMYGANLVHSNCGPAADDVSLKRTSPNRGCHQHLFSTSRQHYSLHSRVSLVLTVDPFPPLQLEINRDVLLQARVHHLGIFFPHAPDEALIRSNARSDHFFVRLLYILCSTYPAHRNTPSPAILHEPRPRVLLQLRDFFDRELLPTYCKPLWHEELFEGRRGTL